jgi:predicted dehydrogenase
LPASGPYTLHYRVNAGFIPRDHWYHDPVQGGGRLIGEGCHFIDLMVKFTGARPIEVYATSMDDGGVYQNDNFTVSMRFSDGSLGNFLYVACGDSSLPKERIEIFAGGVGIIIDDFRSLLISRKGKSKLIKSRWAQDKGHNFEMAEFIRALSTGSPPPIPAEELFLSPLTTLQAMRSLKMRRPFSVDLNEFLERRSPNP